MGMFDRVMVPCPKCGTREDFQSKSGPCELKEYTLEDCPLNVLVGLFDHPSQKCKKCGNLFIVFLNIDPEVFNTTK